MALLLHLRVYWQSVALLIEQDGILVAPVGICSHWHKGMAPQFSLTLPVLEVVASPVSISMGDSPITRSISLH